MTIRLSLAAAVLCAATSSAIADTRSGTANILLTQVFGVEQNGTFSVEGTRKCQATMGDFVGTQLDVQYSVNTTTGIQFATASYMGSDVPLHPLGIAGRYSFMSNGVPPALSEKKVDRIIFNMSLAFGDAEGDVMVVPGGEYNCVISNMAVN